MLCLLYLVAAALVDLSRARPANERLIARYAYEENDVQEIASEKRNSHRITPYVFIVSQFQEEASVWYDYIPELFERPLPVPGFSFAYPNATCNFAGTICQMITGMGETNAAASLTALIFNTQFQLTETYFLIAGISGIDPSKGTTGTVTFARYAVQLDLTYEIDSRQIPSNFTSGIIPLGNNRAVYYDSSIPANDPRSAYPRSIYGTEVYRLNDCLRDRFLNIGVKAESELVDAPAAQEYRALYDSNLPAAQSPRVISCDTQSSNTFWSGTLYEEAYNAYTQLLTNGSSVICTSQQEDNGTLEALLRGHLARRVDYRRVAVMRSASDFTSAPKGVDEAFHLLETNFQGGFPIAVENLGVVGSKIVRNVVSGWTGPDGYKKGVKANKSMGSILVDVLTSASAVVDAWRLPERGALASDTSLRCNSASILPTPTYAGDLDGVFTICAEQEIHASLADVYTAIIDFRAYERWNSFVVNVAVPDDVITAGDVYVEMRMKFTSEGLIPGQAAESDELVTFLEEVPQDGRVFNSWRFDGGGVGEAVMRAEHPNLISDLGNGVVRYVSYETFYGPVALLPGLVLRQNLQTAFEQQGRDLKAYVEGFGAS